MASLLYACEDLTFDDLFFLEVVEPKGNVERGEQSAN